MLDKHYVGLDLTGFENNGEMPPISRVTLLVDDENFFTAGEDSGIEITAECPYATQQMANSILASIKGFRYKMYSASDAKIDPAAELGDGITVSGIYSVISKIDDDGSAYPSLSAPGEAELEEDFPSSGPMTQEFNRKIADTRSSIEKTAEQILLKVVSKDGIVSAINQSAEEIKINAQKISLEGAVSINGTFKIDESGYLRCTGGDIGGFTIGSSALYNGLNSLNGTANGVYVGTDGIALGGGQFKVTSGGALTSNSGTFTSVTIRNSSLDGTLGASGSTINGGTWSQSTINQGYLSGNTGGTYIGSCVGSNFDNCTLNGTTLATGNGDAYVGNNGYGGIYLYGSTGVGIAAGDYGALFSTNGLCSLYGNYTVRGDLIVLGDKNRAINTEHFGARRLSAFESAVPAFSDYGNAALDENGVCYIVIDPVFAESVDAKVRPTVFLTKYGDGDIWVDESGSSSEIIMIRGTSKMSFSWETRYPQANTFNCHMQEIGLGETAAQQQNYNEECRVFHERSAVDYAAVGYEYYLEFERGILQ